MTPISPKIRIAQWIITIILVGILFAMAALYVRYGMNYAQQNVLDEVLVASPAVEATPTELSEIERRMSILEDLTRQSSSTLTQAERSDILDSLANESLIGSVSADARMQTLKSLGANQETATVEVIN